MSGLARDGNEARSSAVGGVIPVVPLERHVMPPSGPHSFPPSTSAVSTSCGAVPEHCSKCLDLIRCKCRDVVTAAGLPALVSSRGAVPVNTACGALT